MMFDPDNLPDDLPEELKKDILKMVERSKLSAQKEDLTDNANMTMIATVESKIIPEFLRALQECPHCTQNDFIRATSAFHEMSENFTEITERMNHHITAIVARAISNAMNSQATLREELVQKLEDLDPGSTSAVAHVPLLKNEP